MRIPSPFPRINNYCWSWVGDSADAPVESPAQLKQHRPYKNLAMGFLKEMTEIAGRKRLGAKLIEDVWRDHCRNIIVLLTVLLFPCNVIGFCNFYQPVVHHVFALLKSMCRFSICPRSLFMSSRGLPDFAGIDSVLFGKILNTTNAVAFRRCQTPSISAVHITNISLTLQYLLLPTP